MDLNKFSVRLKTFTLLIFAASILRHIELAKSKTILNREHEAVIFRLMKLGFF
jgi:hypothetical protein